NVVISVQELRLAHKFFWNTVTQIERIRQITEVRKPEPSPFFIRKTALAK
ncbi:MAG: hypothetical protein JWR18_2645, partial [Segetibacter sp.]|nr:hypothetical protein [Segetibacter sp.]